MSTGWDYEFQRISDAPDVIRAVFLLNKQRPALAIPESWHGMLSRDSPDWYESFDIEYPPPFDIYFIEAGCRLGYRWESILSSGEVNWLDPEPDRESCGYGSYIEELQEIESEVDFYRGFHQPPTAEEYRRLVEATRGG